MQYEIEINGRVRRASVHRADGTFIVDIEGHRWTVDAERIDQRSMSLLIGEAAGSKTQAQGRTVSHDVTVAPEGAFGQLAVSVGTKSVIVLLNGRRRAPGKVEGGQSRAGLQRVVAPMPGRIVRVLVGQGDVVGARQSIVVIEAMKMENELRAAREGVVAEIHVREGQSVEASELLVVIADPGK